MTRAWWAYTRHTFVFGKEKLGRVAVKRFSLFTVWKDNNVCKDNNVIQSFCTTLYLTYSFRILWRNIENKSLAISFSYEKITEDEYENNTE